jgi:hypothetical protein
MEESNDMDTLRFNEIISEQLERCKCVLAQKSAEYTNGVNPLRAFNRAATLLNITPKRALLGMLTKHIVSIYDMCGYYSDTFSRERWEEKITDSINYLILLLAIVVDDIDA